jgi:hypothetical protein
MQNSKIQNKIKSGRKTLTLGVFHNVRRSPGVAQHLESWDAILPCGASIRVGRSVDGTSWGMGIPHCGFIAVVPAANIPTIDALLSKGTLSCADNFKKTACPYGKRWSAGASRSSGRSCTAP